MSDEAVYRTAPATPGLLNIGSVKNNFFLWCRNSVEDVKNRYEACKQVRDIEMQGHTTGKKNKVDSLENTDIEDFRT